MNNTLYPFAAFGIAWAIVFLYIFRIFSKVITLSRRVKEMERKLSAYDIKRDGAL